MIKWYYFYTPDYAFWHRHLQDRLKNHFSLQPIVIQPDTLPINEGTGHHFKGISLKIELLVQCIEQNMGSSILFTDCTLFINDRNVMAFASYIKDNRGDFDVIFADNTVSDDVNIGFIMLQCNKRTLRFWEQLLDSFTADSWDQYLVNQALRTKRRISFPNCPGISWKTFDRSRIVCNYNFNESYRESFFLYKQFINPDSRSSNWNQRLRSLNELGFISDSELRYNLVQER